MPGSLSPPQTGQNLNRKIPDSPLMSSAIPQVGVEGMEGGQICQLFENVKI